MLEKYKNGKCRRGYKKNWLGECIKKNKKEGLIDYTNYLLKKIPTIPFLLSKKEGYRNRKKNRKKVPNGGMNSALAVLKIILQVFINVLLFIYISSNSLHLIRNIDKYIPYPDMSNKYGIVRKLGKEIRKNFPVDGSVPPMRGGGLKPGETPNQTKWFKEGAFFDSWAGDGKPPPEWLKQEISKEEPNMFSRGMGHYFQTFRDIPILLVLMEASKLIKGFIPVGETYKDPKKMNDIPNPGSADFLSLILLAPLFFLGTSSLNLIFSLFSIPGGIVYKQDLFSWVAPLFTWWFFGIFGLIASFLVFHLIILMPNKDKRVDFFKYFLRYRDIWLLIIFGVAIQKIMNEFKLDFNIQRWNDNHKYTIIPVISIFTLLVLKSIYDVIKFALN